MGSSAFSTSPWEPVERLACTEQFQSGSSHPPKGKILEHAQLDCQQSKMCCFSFNPLKLHVPLKYRMWSTYVGSGLLCDPCLALQGLHNILHLFVLFLPGLLAWNVFIFYAWLLKSVRYCSCPCRKWAKEDISWFWTMPNMAMNWANCCTCMFESLWLTRSEWFHDTSCDFHESCQINDFARRVKESFFSFLRVQSHDRSEEQILSGPAVLSQQLRCQKSIQVLIASKCIEDAQTSQDLGSTETAHHMIDTIVP